MRIKSSDKLFKTCQPRLISRAGEVAEGTWPNYLHLPGQPDPHVHHFAEHALDRGPQDHC